MYSSASSSSNPHGYSRSVMKRRRIFRAGPSAKRSRTVRSYSVRRRRRNIRTGGFLGIENKFVDYEKTSTNTTNAVAGGEIDPGTVLCLNGVAQGDGESQRDGRKYKMNSLHITGRLNLAANTDGANLQSSVNTRLVVVLDKQTNGAQMNAEDCFVDPTAGALAPYTFRNLENSGRFVVLYDKLYTLNVNAASGNGTTNDTADLIKAFKINIKIPERYSQVNTKGTSAAVTDITDNSIHLLAWSGVDAKVSVAYISRLRFVG